MPAVLGIDLNSRAIDLVLIDEDTDQATWTHLDLGGATSFDRCRSVPSVMPGHSWFDDNGVYLVAIEKPIAASFVSAGALLPVFGAIVVSIPTKLVLWSFSPAEWKGSLKVPLREKPSAKRIAEIVGEVALAWPQDALDACGIAYAAREQNGQAVGTRHAA